MLQHLIGVRILLRHPGGDRRQALLQRRQQRCRLLRFGQAEQGDLAVIAQFLEPLDQLGAFAALQSPVLDEQAAEAVGMKPEIAPDPGMTIRHVGNDEIVGGEILGDGGGRRLIHNHGDMGRADDAAGQSGQPARHIVKGGKIEQRPALDRGKEAVGHEFGMPLPGEMKLIQARRQKTVARLRDGSMGHKQTCQRRQTVARLLLVDQQDELHGLSGCIEAGQAAYVHFPRQRRPQGMIALDQPPEGIGRTGCPFVHRPFSASPSCHPAMTPCRGLAFGLAWPGGGVQLDLSERMIGSGYWGAAMQPAIMAFQPFISGR